MMNNKQESQQERPVFGMKTIEVENLTRTLQGCLCSKKHLLSGRTGRNNSVFLARMGPANHTIRMLTGQLTPTSGKAMWRLQCGRT